MREKGKGKNWNKDLDEDERFQAEMAAKREVKIERAKKTATRALRQIPRGTAFGTDLFNAIALLTVGTAFEGVALRRRRGKIQVFMTLRSATDSAYAKEWHCPGTFQRTDEGPVEVFERLAAAKEFEGPISNWKPIGLFINRTEQRGTTNSWVFLVRVQPGKVGKWFPLDDLPKNTVCHHRDTIIPMAVRRYTGKVRDFQLKVN